MRQAALQGQRQVSGSGCKIDDRLRVPLRDNLRCAITPKEIASAAEKMICEVVASRDCPKHRADFRGIALVCVNQVPFPILCAPVRALDRSQASLRASRGETISAART